MVATSARTPTSSTRRHLSASSGVTARFKRECLLCIAEFHRVATPLCAAYISGDCQLTWGEVSPPIPSLQAISGCADSGPQSGPKSYVSLDAAAPAAPTDNYCRERPALIGRPADHPRRQILRIQFEISNRQSPDALIPLPAIEGFGGRCSGLLSERLFPADGVSSSRPSCSPAHRPVRYAGLRPTARPPWTSKPRRSDLSDGPCGWCHP